MLRNVTPIALSVLGTATLATAQPEVPPVAEQLQDPKSADVTVVGSVVEPSRSPTWSWSRTPTFRRMRHSCTGLRHPGGRHRAARSLPGATRLPLPEGAKQGANDHGSTGWTGMKPPVGDPAHPYHFQVFALDTRLDLPHGAGRAELIEAMRRHVLSAGEVVGRYARD